MLVTAGAEKHPKVVAEVHVDVKQTASDSDTLAVKTELPKSRPDTVIELRPITALFSRLNVSTAASKVNTDSPVPTVLPTLTVPKSTSDTAGDERHCSVVAVVHVVVLQKPFESAAAGEKSTVPKLRPIIVTELPPLRALFSSTSDRTAASKVYPRYRVPATDPTVKVETSVIVAGTYAVHATVVSDVHDDVSHAASDSVAVAVRSK